MVILPGKLALHIVHPGLVGFLPSFSFLQGSDGGNKWPTNTPPSPPSEPLRIKVNQQWEALGDRGILKTKEAKKSLGCWTHGPLLVLVPGIHLVPPSFFSLSFGLD